MSRLDGVDQGQQRARAAVWAPSTMRGIEEGYRLRVRPTLGAHDVADIDREQVEVWLAVTAATSSPHATWKVVKALRAILKVGVEWGRIPANPAAGLRLPRPVAAPASERALNEAPRRRRVA